MATLLDHLTANAAQRADSLAFRFLPTGEVGGPEITVTHGRLHQRVGSLAAVLRRHCAPGDRALLLYPGGADFVVAFLACLRAGVIAVPTSGPGGERADRALARSAAVAADCAPSVILTTAEVAASVDFSMSGEPAGVRRLVTDRPAEPFLTAEPGAAAEETVTEEAVDEDTVAFIQYTSGSTGSPRGVVVTHANLMHNLRGQQELWQQGPDAHIVSWLPVFHDMGLIAGLLYAVFVGADATVMPPEAFVQRPLRWLEAISAFGGTFGCAPDFGYALCVRAAADADVSGLDLSTWEVAVNGAEPVRAGTLERFAARFAPAGFRREALSPGYGLAESTLAVATVPLGRTPRITGHGVSCGQVLPGTRVVVVSPRTGLPVASGETGEIWVNSPSNASGYWNRPAETKEFFEARLDGDDAPYLRTGDLGILEDGELYVTGRIKDLIIVGGRNHYPQDIEQTVERASPLVRPGCVAAFTTHDDERLVIVAEVRDGADAAAQVPVIRGAVAADHGLDAAAVVLIAPRTLPKTTSGKLRRGECRALFLDGTLAVRHAWHAARFGPRTAEQVESWLITCVARLTGLDVRGIGLDQSFDSLGLSSAQAVGLSGDLSEWLGQPVAATAVYDHPTIGALARHLTGTPDETEPAPAANLTEQIDGAHEAVAIVGIGCRFPGADGPDGFWDLLCRGAEAVGDIPADRWDVPAFLAEGGGPAPGRMYTGKGAFLDDVTGFDPVFFGMSAAEARYLDPQQRLLLELAWEAFEDAGILPQSLAGTDAGVFVGITTSDYVQVMRAAGIEPGPYAGTGNVFTMAANRISYTFDLRGPSLAVDTACSSALVAIHQARVSLLRGECDTALAGGVNLMLSPDTTVGLCQTGALSPDGHCYSFDARANGYVRGEGSGLVLLKRLSRALADGDRVYAVIRGSAVNQDGRSNGLTAPSAEAHTAVIRKAHREAGLAPGLLRYVEAHGTGTALGDPIEAGAVGRVLAGELPEGAVCAIGSVKSNIGHLEAAAGVAGVVKAALSLHHAALPPSLHFDTPNEHIDFAALRLTVPTALRPWPDAGGRPGTAGVNSFGVGGTNAHVVLDTAPPAARTGADDGRRRLFVLSARTPAALDRLADRVTAFLPRTEATLEELCATAALRRTTHEYRLAVAAGSTDELADRLRHAVRGRAVRDRRSRLVFVFAGQGAQYVGMARTLYLTEPAFAVAFDACDRLVEPLLGWSPRSQLLADEFHSRLDLDEVAQTMLFSVQVALVGLWREQAVVPDAVIGHSMGEVAAAFAAGALSLPDAVRVTCLRSRLLSALRGQGAMAVVGLSRRDSAAELERYGGRLHLAAVNGPKLCVVSGGSDAIADLAAACEQRDVFCRPLKAGGAGHSPVVDPVARRLADELADLEPQATAVPLYSSVTGDVIKGDELDGAYWGRNVRQTVLFHPAVERLIADGHHLFLELSPNPALVIPVQDALRTAGAEGGAVGTLVRSRDDRDCVLEALGALWAAGHPVDLARFCDTSLPVVSLPSGPWQRETIWFDGRGTPGQAETDRSVAETVRRAFSDVLRVSRVEGRDGFFDLGGTSLMAAQMLHDLRSALAMEIPLRLLFDNPTPDALCAALEARLAAEPQERRGPDLVRVEAEDFPLTINQERLLLAERDDDTRRAAHVLAQHLVLDGPVDRAALASAVLRVVALHDGLRTRFSTDGTRQFHDAPPAQSPLTYGGAEADGAVGTDGPDGGLRAALRVSERPFDPGEPLYRFHLVEADGRHILCTALSHLITDGWSQGVLLLDLISAYEAAAEGRPDRLEPPLLRLADYAVWERATFSGGYLDEQVASWRQMLAAAWPPVPRFVRDIDRTGRTAARPGLTEAVIRPDLQAGLDAVSRATAATPQMVMLAAYLLTLRSHSGQQTVTVPASWSARDRPDLQRVMGFLSQPQLVTCDFTGAPSLREGLRRVREAVLDAGERQRLSMSQYFHIAGLDQDEIPFHISMNYLPPLDLPTRMGNAAVTLLPRQGEFSLYRDILFVVRTVDGATRLSFGYADDLIAPEDMAGFVADLVGVLEDFAADLDRPLRPIDGSQERLEASGPAVAEPGGPAAPLRRVEAEEYPLTISQRRLLSQDPRTSAQTIAQHLLLDGPLDRGALEGALDRIVAVHAGLRTVFTRQSAPVDYVQSTAPHDMPPHLSVSDLRGVDEAGRRAHLARLERPFRTAGTVPDGPLYRFHLAVLGEDQYLLSIVVDHLLADGWSVAVLLHDLRAAYLARPAGRDDALAEPDLRLVDYAAWEHAVCMSSASSAALEYWRGELAAARPPRLAFARTSVDADTAHTHEDTHGAGGSTPTRQAHLVEVDLDPALTDQLTAAARAAAATPAMLVLTGVLLGLRRHCDQDVLSVPTNAVGRGHPGLERTVGFLSVLHLITAHLPAGLTGRAALARVRDAVLDADQHQYPISLSQYAYLIGTAHPDLPFAMSVNQLPDISLPADWGPGTAVTILKQDSYVLTRDLVLVVHKAEGRLRLSFGHAAEVLPPDGVRRLTDDIVSVLEDFVADPDTPITVYRDPRH